MVSASILCLASAMYFEAGNQGVTGQLMVAQVILNRVKSEYWPDTICGVIKQKGQFSYLWDKRADKVSDKTLWRESLGLAKWVVDSTKQGLTPALHTACYYARKELRHYWSKGYKSKTYRSHKFYLKSC